MGKYTAHVHDCIENHSFFLFRIHKKYQFQNVFRELTPLPNHFSLNITLIEIQRNPEKQFIC